jgi:hypothetical protein
MVEMNIFYMAIYPELQKVIFNTTLMQSMPNILDALVPDNRQYADVVHVIDVRDKKLVLVSDIVAQEMVCFFE